MVSGTSRTASSAINRPIASALANVSHKHRPTSHLIATSDPGSHTDIYRHPAVKAYMTAHPHEASYMAKFGPYLLLQMLDKGDSHKPALVSMLGGPKKLLWKSSNARIPLGSETLNTGLRFFGYAFFCPYSAPTSSGSLFLDTSTSKHHPLIQRHLDRRVSWCRPFVLTWREAL